MNLSRILQIIALVISLVAVYFFVKVSTGEEGSEALSSSVGGFINFTKFLLIGVGMLVTVFMVLGIVKDPKVLKKTLIGLAIFLLLFVVAYVISGDGEVVTSTNVVEAGSTLSKRVSTGINFSMILGGIAFAGFIFDSVKSLLK